jgi:putative PEP-CTERM system histidine kinase
MNLTEAIQFIGIIAGLSTAAIVMLNQRFGPASWLVGAFLAFGSAMPACLLVGHRAYAQPAEIFYRLAISALLLATAFGLLFVWSMGQPNYWQALAKKRKAIAAALLPIPVLIIFMNFFFPHFSERNISKKFIELGPLGSLASIYLLTISIIAISYIEQMVRGVEERIKWEIKFLALGLAGSYAAIIYLGSKALLYSVRYAFMPRDAFSAFTFIFPLCCILILVSWRRSFGIARIGVSQNFIFSSITLLSVGFYLIASAFVARWVSIKGELGRQTEPVIFLISIIALAAILLWTSFRHRMRDWIRRNVFTGKYDYRQYWMQATSEVRSLDGPEKSALALANLIQRSLGAIDIGIWLRDQERIKIQFTVGLGNVSDIREKQVKGMLEKFAENADPLTVEDIGMTPENTAVRAFFEQTNAALIVPLCSSGQLIGMLTVGSDRSGRAYNWEAREFLRVIANHAASEFHKHEMLKTLVEAKEAEAFKSFSTFLLHDLKNFASTLSLIAQNAGRHQDNPEFQRDAFLSILETAEKMKRLCNNLRTFSTSLAANKKQCDLNKIVHSAVKSLNSGLLQQIHLELGELQPVFVDPEEIIRVLQNLLLNAREAITPNGLITVRTGRQNGDAEITVADDGKGMAKDFLEKELFLPFHTTKSNGLGIGLFQCKKIIEAHEGCIDIKSEEGVGTTVSVKFPLIAGAC